MGFWKKVKKWGKRAAKAVALSIAPNPIQWAYAGITAARSIYKFAHRNDEYKDLLRVAEDRAESILDLANRANEAALIEAGGYDTQAGLAEAAAARAEAMARENAAAIRKEGDLYIERKEKEHAKTEATTRARLAAQGRDTGTGSAKIYRKAMRRENKAEIVSIEESIANQMKNALNQGHFIAQEAKAGAAGYAAQAEAIRAAGRQGIATARAQAESLLAEASTKKPKKGNKWFDLATGLGEAGLILTA